MIELEVVGPFSWISSSADDPPWLFDAPEANNHGVYFFTVVTARGQQIYWVGQTSQPIRTRLATHSREFLAGTYNILDMAKLRDGQRVVVWKGLWWRKDSANRYEEYLLRASEVAPLTLAQLRATHIYIVQTAKDRRFLARLEAAIVKTLYTHPEVGEILDRGYSLSARWRDEEPIHVQINGPEFIGLPRQLLI